MILSVGVKPSVNLPSGCNNLAQLCSSPNNGYSGVFGTP